jgi:hypothetical protein
MLFLGNTNGLEHQDDIQQARNQSRLSSLDQRVLRISTSALSILTTKAIYIHGYHHPLRLLLLHLAATSLWETILWLSSRRVERIFDAKDCTLYELTRRGNSWSRAGLKLCLRFGFGTGALFCEYQAIYRFRSLPALAMLLLPDWSVLIRLVRHKNVPMLRKIIAIFGCLMGVTMILVSEYQLSEVGLKLVTTTVSLSVASQVLRQEPSTLDDDDRLIKPSLPFAPIRDKVILLPVTVAAAVLAIYMREYLIYTPPLSNMLLVTLAVNTLAAVVTFQSSGSYFKQTEPLATLNGVEENYEEDEIDPALETISFHTVLVLGSVLVNSTINSPFTVSIWQYIGFWIALATLLWTGRQFRSSATDDIYHASVTVSHDYSLPDFDTPEYHERQKSTRLSGLLQVIFVGTCLLLSISPLLFAPGSPQTSPHRMPRDDRLATPSTTTRTLDFVVSRYDESAIQLARQINLLHSLPNIRFLDTRLIVYNTGSDNKEIYKSYLQQHLHPSINITIIQRQNVGREAAAYLTHILSPPHQPFASHTFFLQAEMHSASLVLPRVNDYFIANTGFLSLSDTHQGTNTCAQHPWDTSTWSESPSVLSPIFTALNITKCVDYAFTYRGQFIVSAQRILSNAPAVYSLLLQNLIDQNATTHTKQYRNQPWLPSKQDSLNAPLFGFTMERLWGLVFGCEGKMEGCPSLMHGALGKVIGGGRRGGVGECQCLDRL